MKAFQQFPIQEYQEDMIFMRLHRLPNQLAFMLAINIRLKKLLFYIFVLVCQHVSATKMASYYNQGLKGKEMVRRH